MKSLTHINHPTHIKYILINKINSKGKNQLSQNSSLLERILSPGFLNDIIPIENTNNIIPISNVVIYLPPDKKKGNYKSHPFL